VALMGQCHLVECKDCGTKTVVTDGQNVHDALVCRCCGADHTHADENGMTQNPCRNVHIYANAVVVPLLEE